MVATVIDTTLIDSEGSFFTYQKATHDLSRFHLTSETSKKAQQRGTSEQSSWVALY